MRTPCTRDMWVQGVTFSRQAVDGLPDPRTAA
jgi:hypothetical protein